jgi:hypothetical protein
MAKAKSGTLKAEPCIDFTQRYGVGDSVVAEIFITRVDINDDECTYAVSFSQTEFDCDDYKWVPNEYLEDSIINVNPAELRAEKIKKQIEKLQTELKELGE